MACHSRPAALADLPHAVEAVECPPNRGHNSSAGCREANPKGATLEYRHTKLILQADDASTDRRRVDAERFGSTRKAASFDHDSIDTGDPSNPSPPSPCWRRH